MSNYRRAKTPGGSYFFTVVTYRRQPLLTLTESRAILRSMIRETRQNHPFAIDAWVLLPKHLHCIWSLPPGDTDHSTRWGIMKGAFPSRHGNYSSDRNGSINPRQTSREYNMAATFLETRNSRSGRFQPVLRLHSLESGQAAACIPRRRLAVFDVSSICRAGPIVGELGR